MVEGISTPSQRSDRVVLEANLDYWDTSRFPKLQRIIFDNTLEQQQALEFVKTGEGQVDVVTGLSPLETLRVAQSPFAKVVKARGSLTTVLGLFNMRKTESPWRDVRLRQAANMAINRADLIRYAAKGNGTIIPALVTPQGFGHDQDLAPYPFDPDRTQHLLRQAGYANGLPTVLLATKDLEVQATVVSKMLEHAGFQVDLRLLTPADYNRQTLLSHLEQSPEQHAWDIALTVHLDNLNSPVFGSYNYFVLDGPYDWVNEQPELRQLYAQALRTMDRDRQQEVIRQMERHAHDQAYFLFLYNPITLYAVNKAVEFVPYVSTILTLAETGVTNEHWSIRKQKAAVHE
jgi:peptide/nickel transport system substrate-binding protein